VKHKHKVDLMESGKMAGNQHASCIRCLGKTRICRVCF